MNQGEAFGRICPLLVAGRYDGSNHCITGQCMMWVWTKNKDENRNYADWDDEGFCSIKQIGIEEMSGHKIIEGLKEAVAGDLSRVTVSGQTWVRLSTPRKEGIQEALAEKFHEAFRKGVICPEWGKVSNDWRLAVMKGVSAVLDELK